MKPIHTSWLALAGLCLAACSPATAQVESGLGALPVVPFQSDGLKIGMTAADADAVLGRLDSDVRACNARGGTLMTDDMMVKYQTGDRCRNNPQAQVTSINVTMLDLESKFFGAANADTLVSAITEQVGGAPDCTERSEARASCVWNAPASSTGAGRVELRAGTWRPSLTFSGAPVTAAASSSGADFVSASEIDVLAPFGARGYMPMSELHDILLAAGLTHEATSSRRTCEYVLERPSSITVRVSVAAGTRCDQQAPVEVLTLTMSDYRPASNATFVADDIAAAWVAQVDASSPGRCTSSEGNVARRVNCSWAVAPPPGYRGLTAKRNYYPGRSGKTTHSTMNLRVHWADPEAPPPTPSPDREGSPDDRLRDVLNAPYKRGD